MGDFHVQKCFEMGRTSRVVCDREQSTHLIHALLRFTQTELKRKTFCMSVWVYECISGWVDEWMSGFSLPSAFTSRYMRSHLCAAGGSCGQFSTLSIHSTFLRCCLFISVFEEQNFPCDFLSLQTRIPCFLSFPSLVHFSFFSSSYSFLPVYFSNSLLLFPFSLS